MSALVVHILCEGQTEQGFVNEVLKPYLLENGAAAVKSIIVTTNKRLAVKGGLLKYSQAKDDLSIMMRNFQDGEYEHHVFSTMFDLYALPNDFPQYADSMRIMDKYDCVASLEQAFGDDISNDRFIPYIQLHEFEALVFCGIDFLLDLYPMCEKSCKRLKAALYNVSSPEQINDGQETAPSKRIIRAIEGTGMYSYNKPMAGKYVTVNVGIDSLRLQCPHFNEWINKILDFKK